MKSIQENGISLYIHIPFCKTKCPYCDFNTYQGIDNLMDPFLDALRVELELWGKVLGHPPVNTVFFGGGTPSYLPEGRLGEVLSTARDAFILDETAEITVEANPGDLDQAACQRMLQQGVNRLSIGTQSFNNDLLTLLGRRHDADTAVTALEAARDAGFTNVNLDFMYGIPRQTMAQWEDTLAKLTDLAPQHVSLYALTLEEGTPLQSWVSQGQLPAPDQDLAADMYHRAEDVLEESGYGHYEISNWSFPGCEARHNLAYWLSKHYLGVGPGAHSCLNGHRFWDMDSPRGYISQVQKWREANPAPLSSITSEALESIPQVGGQEHIDPDTECGEAMFLGLRLLDGMDLAKASARVGRDLETHFGSEIQGLVADGLLEQKGSQLRLTKTAYLIANQVFTKFVG
ncbi:MAG: radical SAM family heme chaperone HemW [Chloroflexi bacterium]|nr:radical SAM family heme chaperone HemW [Chloroflexota bacterium]